MPWSTFFARKSSVFWWAPSILALVIKQEQLFHSERAPISNGFGVTIYCPPALLEPCGRRPPCWLGHRDVHHHLPQHRLLHRLAHRPSHQDSFQVSENLFEIWLRLFWLFCDHLENIGLGCLTWYPVLHRQPTPLRKGHPE